MHVFLLFPFIFSMSASTLHEVHRSFSPNPSNILRRQTGYGPEYGQCDVGTTCKDSCGQNYEECAASTDLALFCYNPIAGQTCCDHGNGKACDKGFYCTQDSRNDTWCCEGTLSVSECAALFGFDPPISSTSSSVSTTATSSQSSSESAAPSTTTPGPAFTPVSNYTRPNNSNPIEFTGNAPTSWQRGSLDFSFTTNMVFVVGIILVYAR